MSCRLYRVAGSVQGVFYRATEQFFVALNSAYAFLLRHALAFPIIVLAIGIGLSAAAYGFYQGVKQEFAPTEDRGVFLVVLKAPEGATIDYTLTYLQESEKLLQPLLDNAEADTIFGVVAPGLSRPSPVNFAIAFVVLNPWHERERSQQEIVKEMFPKLLSIPGANVFAINPPSLNEPGR